MAAPHCSLQVLQAIYGGRIRSVRCIGTLGVEQLAGDAGRVDNENEAAKDVEMKDIA